MVGWLRNAWVLLLKGRKKAPDPVISFSASDVACIVFVGKCWVGSLITQGSM